MKKTILLIFIFALTISFQSCAALGLKTKKDEALDAARKSLCADPEETKMIIKGTRFEGALDLEQLCAS